jgi:hypothetical protein
MIFSAFSQLLVYTCLTWLLHNIFFNSVNCYPRTGYVWKQMCPRHPARLLTACPVLVNKWWFHAAIDSPTSISKCCMLTVLIVRDNKNLISRHCELWLLRLLHALHFFCIFFSTTYIGPWWVKYIRRENAKLKQHISLIHALWYSNLCLSTLY